MVPRVQATLENLADERRRLERFARSLTAHELARPVPGTVWTVGDFIAHVATLDAAYIGWFAALAGDPDRGDHRGSPGFDVDRFNELAVSERRGRSVDRLLDEGATLRGRLVAIIARFTEDNLDAVIRFGGDRKRPPVDAPLGQFLMGWTRHDAIHVADMLKALPERRSDPELVAWLARPDVATSISSYQKAMG
ncbi:MAG TPA: DinB family protein [Candidatus Bathyarchaeia archaeon]|nr:DinB family protein [Candidatus Bathyarchaeia archaeon]